MKNSKGKINAYNYLDNKNKDELISVIALLISIIFFFTSFAFYALDTNHSLMFCKPIIYISDTTNDYISWFDFISNYKKLGELYEKECLSNNMTFSGTMSIDRVEERENIYVLYSDEEISDGVFNQYENPQVLALFISKDKYEKDIGDISKMGKIEFSGKLNNIDDSYVVLTEVEVCGG